LLQGQQGGCPLQAAALSTASAPNHVPSSGTPPTPTSPAGPDYRKDPDAVLNPGVNKLCRQPNGKKNDPVEQEDIVFPVDWPTAGAGPTDPDSNRIIALFARVDVNTGDIAELTFLFDWIYQSDPNIPPDPTKDVYFSSKCGNGQIYTDTKFFFHKLDRTFPGLVINSTVNSTGYQSVLCGLRAQCQAPLLGKHGGVVKHTRHTSDMKLPLLPCWSEEVKASALAICRRCAPRSLRGRGLTGL
jgi:hypothetical protein